MNPLRPFPAARLVEIADLLARVPSTVDDFERLRARLSGLALRVEGLRALLAAEPALAGPLRDRILPSIVRHARGLVEGAPTLAPHEQGVAGRAVVSRAEVAGWIAHMVLGTLPGPAAQSPHTDFAPLLSAEWPAETAKLRCLLAYFDRIADAPPPGRIEIERLVAEPRSAPDWVGDSSPLVPVEVAEQGGIEDALRHRQVDFANRYLGGGVLSGGCVQEEIRFAVSPELLVGMIVSPRMRDDEAIVLRGSERFARTRGYGHALRFAGPFDDPCGRASDGTPDAELVAIDAIDFHSRRREPGEQFTVEAILRDLNKARCGFLRDARGLPIATGNWGCGVFGGDPALKAVIQWLAASAEGRAVRYFPFGNERVGDLAGFASAARARHRTVGALAERLFAATAGGSRKLYQRLLDA